MRNNYTLRKIIAFKALVLLIFLGINENVLAQSRVDFKPRTSQNATGNFAGKTIYNLQGDFTMVGNTNLTLVNYGNETNNNASMKYVDIDNDASTWNSSSATLGYANGINAACTRIIYAGLYWTGRPDDNENNSPSTVTVTKNGTTRIFDKKEVKFKGPNGTYQTITATANDIYFPTSGSGVMYAAYADVTAYVRDHGIGDYFVADMALREGATSSGTGYYGGWGMVIIYENTTMKWRDITVFDGYSYITGGTTASYTLDVGGFKAVKNGPVNIKMGMMAGEGDRGISGDYFQIIDNNNNWVPLSHSGNSATNFFNSSIATGGNARNPNLLNNTGLDVSMFDLANTNNSIITNNQTSTKFQYGSTQDTYIIFNIVFAVDAYVPVIEALNIPATSSTVLNGGDVSPGQDVEFQLDLYNKGTEAIKDGKVEVQLPPTLHYVSATIQSGGGTVAWVSPDPNSSDPNVTPGGKIVWDIGNIPLHTNTNDLLGTLKYKVRITSDCTLLTTSPANCNLAIRLNGNVTGEGVNSNELINSGFIIGYTQLPCAGDPIRDPFVMNIKLPVGYSNNCPATTNDGFKLFTANCSIPNDVFLRESVVNNYPIGTLFYSSVPYVTGYEGTLVTGDFPVDADGTVRKYYAIVPAMGPGCYLQLSLSVDLDKCKMMTNPMIPAKMNR